MLGVSFFHACPGVRQAPGWPAPHVPLSQSLTLPLPGIYPVPQELFLKPPVPDTGQTLRAFPRAATGKQTRMPPARETKQHTRPGILCFRCHHPQACPKPDESEGCSPVTVWTGPTLLPAAAADSDPPGARARQVRASQIWCSASEPVSQRLYWGEKRRLVALQQKASPVRPTCLFVRVCNDVQQHSTSPTHHQTSLTICSVLSAPLTHPPGPRATLYFAHAPTERAFRTAAPSPETAWRARGPRPSDGVLATEPAAPLSPPAGSCRQR